MIKEKKIRLGEFIIIFFVWSMIFAGPLLFDNNYHKNWTNTYIVWIEYFVAFIIFLINRTVLMSRFFFKKKYIEYFISVFVLLTVMCFVMYYFDVVSSILKLMGITENGPSPRPDFGHPSPPPFPPRPLFIHVLNLLVITLVAVALDLGLRIAVEWIINEQKQADLKAETVNTQLSKLQSQVSPHFLMNTLNNIHALIELDPPKAQETIIELSDLMGYLLYELSNTDKVPLERELDFIDNYVKLMRLRYPEKVKIVYEYDSEVPAVKIPPLLFLNFIENAFKYGVDYSKDSSINIRFHFTKSDVTMVVTNTNHSDSVKRDRKGMGIANSRKRLDLLYNDQYQLEIDDNALIYKVTLKIPIL